MKFFSIPALFIFIAIALGVILVGGFDFGKFSKPGDTPVVSGQCCESGDGDACQPGSGAENTITYNGQTYGLIKAKIELIEGNVHLKDSGQTVNGDPIILNSSNEDNFSFNELTSQGYQTYCNATPNNDTYFRKIPSAQDVAYLNTSVNESTFVRLLQSYCTSIPDDQLIFVCKENCHAATCRTPENHCYGDKSSVYDIYYRNADLSSSGIPDFIKNCEKAPALKTTKKMVAVTQQPQRQNLQLQTFGFETETINPGLSPFCKPAIYLYPEKETKVSVKVSPVGPIIYSIPEYPTNGWDVTAKPSGEVLSNNTSFDYLYYEAEIPDEKIEKPTSGYVVKKEDVRKTLEEMLPKLGLNKKEKDQFVEYWIKVLPDSPYFFIGAVSTQNLDSIAPLSISPKPSSVIRVGLYFEALDSFKIVPKPILNSIARKGFTVVEWGGIFKRTKDHPFSCFM